jgi:TonB family protein
MWVLALLLAQEPAVDRYLLWRSDLAVPQGPNVVIAVAPVFPRELTTGPEGETVVVEVEVGEDGLVKRAEVLEAKDVSARDSATRAIAGWRFLPPGGQASSTRARVVFRYRTMPVGTPADSLTTIFRGRYEIEVRSLGRNRR